MEIHKHFGAALTGNLKFTFKNMAVVGLLAFGSMSTSADIITHGDYSWDDTTNYVTDENADLEWLRWTETTNMSIDSALLANVNDGYRLATNVEMAGLFSSFFTGTSWGTDENTRYGHVGPTNGVDDEASVAFFDVFSTTRSYCSLSSGCTDVQRLTYSSALFGSDGDSDGFYNNARVSDFTLLNDGDGGTVPSEDSASLTHDLSFQTRSFKNSFLGVALVRDASAVPVPEPTSLTLLGLGIVGLGFARRQKKS